MSTRVRHDRRDEPPEHANEFTSEHNNNIVCVCASTLRTCPTPAHGKTRFRRYTPSRGRTTTCGSSSSSSRTVVVVTETLKWVLNSCTRHNETDIFVHKLSTTISRHITPWRCNRE